MPTPLALLLCVLIQSPMIVEMCYRVRKGVPMALIRVNPDSIRQYAAAAQSQFDAVRGELQGLVSDAVEVRYFGPNAVEFKTRCGQMAVDFAQRLGQDLGRIADAVRV